MRLRDLHPRRFFFDAWRELDREAVAFRAGATDAELGKEARKALYLFVVVAVSLTVQDRKSVV